MYRIEPPMNLIRKFLCRWFGIHDWRYASTIREFKAESRARCQWCEMRQWTRFN